MLSRLLRRTVSAFMVAVPLAMNFATTTHAAEQGISRVTAAVLNLTERIPFVSVPDLISNRLVSHMVRELASNRDCHYAEARWPLYDHYLKGIIPESADKDRQRDAYYAAFSIRRQVELSEVGLSELDATALLLWRQTLLAAGKAYFANPNHVQWFYDAKRASVLAEYELMDGAERKAFKACLGRARDGLAAYFNNKDGVRTALAKSREATYALLVAQDHSVGEAELMRLRRLASEKWDQLVTKTTELGLDISTLEYFARREKEGGSALITAYDTVLNNLWVATPGD